MEEHDSERLTYDFREVCTALGMNEYRVRGLMHRAERPLPFVRWRGRVVFPREAVRLWLLEESGVTPLARESASTAQAV